MTRSKHWRTSGPGPASQPRSARAGRWRPGWSTGAERLGAALQRLERCPPDWRGNRGSEPGAGWRETPGHGAGSEAARERWRLKHTQRRSVYRTLRAAGYHARRSWACKRTGERRHGRNVCESWTYTSGDVAGLEAVDPWEVARRVRSCCSSYRAGLYMAEDGQLAALPLPALCGQRHVCPVCASVRSAALSRAVRRVARETIEAGSYCALVTLTQRSRPHEGLAAAVDRWLRAWALVTRGRRGRRWRTMAAAAFRGLEVTWREGRGWHVHAHVVVALHPGTFHEAAREWLLGAWLDATAEAAAPARLRKAGHVDPPTTPGASPLALMGRPGEHPDDTAIRYLAGRSDGPWWAALTHDEDPETGLTHGPRDTDAALSAVHEACKYATPAVQLPAAQLAEFCAAAFRRRWHQGSGAWRSVIKDAADLEASDALAADLAAEEADPDGERRGLGEPIAGIGPGDAPPVDDLSPGVGTEGNPCSADPAPPDAPGQAVEWRLSDAALDADPYLVATLRRRGYEVTHRTWGDGRIGAFLSVPAAVAHGWLAYGLSLVGPPEGGAGSSAGPDG